MKIVVLERGTADREDVSIRLNYGESESNSKDPRAVEVHPRAIISAKKRKGWGKPYDLRVIERDQTPIKIEDQHPKNQRDAEKAIYDLAIKRAGTFVDISDHGGIIDEVRGIHLGIAAKPYHPPETEKPAVVHKTEYHETKTPSDSRVIATNRKKLPSIGTHSRPYSPANAVAKTANE
jgi:hypothetical protein